MQWGRKIISSVQKQIELKKMIVTAFEKATEEIQNALKESELLKDEVARYYYDVNKGEYRVMTLGQSYYYSFADIKTAIREAVNSGAGVSSPNNDAIVFMNVLQEHVDEAVRSLIYKDLVDIDIQ
jgi:proline dehydrogenase